MSRRIRFMPGSTVDEAVTELLAYKEQGLVVCGTFNGIELCSDTVTMDGAYLATTGMKQDEFLSKYPYARTKAKEEE